MSMIITVAIVCCNGGQKFSDCLHCLTSQRVISADRIRVYDLGSEDGSQQTAQTYGCKVIPLARRAFVNETALMRHVIYDNLDSDILISLAPDAEIDPSGICELFRYFLKYPDLAVVTGRQVPAPNAGHLTRYTHNFLYPFTRKDIPAWHLQRVFSSFAMVAWRTRYLAIPGVVPGSSVYAFADIYIAARLASKGYRTLYNPMAICLTGNTVTPGGVFRTGYHLFWFLRHQSWLRHRWNLRIRDARAFFKGFSDYLSSYSSIPLMFLWAWLLYLITLLAALLCNIRCYFSERQKRKTGKGFIRRLFASSGRTSE